MIETHLNIFDSVVIGIMLLSCLIAFFRGFVKEVLSLGAWIGAGIVTVYFMQDVGKLLQPHFKKPEVATGVGALALYISALIGFSLINMMIQKFLKAGSDVGLLDNMLGLLFGAFRGAFIISLGFFLISIALSEKEYPVWIKESITHPYVEKGAIILTRIAPEYMSEASTLQKKAVAQAQEQMENKREDGTKDEGGYSRDTNRQFDRLIQSTEPSR